MNKLYISNHLRLFLILIAVSAGLAVWANISPFTIKNIPAGSSNLENNIFVTVHLHPKQLNYDSTKVVFDIDNLNAGHLAVDELALETSNKSGMQANLLKDTSRLAPFVLNTSKNQWIAVIRGNTGNIPSQKEPGTQASRFFLDANQPLAVKKFHLTLKDSETKEKITPLFVRYIDDETNRYREDIVASPEEFVGNNPQFQIQKSVQENGREKKIITLGPGEIYFKNIVIIPKTADGLRVYPGTNLYFMPDTSLFSYAPVDAEGTANRPIRFTSTTDKPWGTFAIVGTHEKESHLSYVIVEHAKQAKVNGATFTGGISSYFSDIKITESIIRYNQSDDGINVKSAHAIVERNQFINNKADGLDFDSVSGLVSNNIFENNGNDGMDVSFNRAVIENNISRKNSDKCISLGERSQAPVKNNYLVGCTIGIAVKDESNVVLEGNTITDNLQGIAVYTKKPFFEKPETTLINNTME